MLRLTELKLPLDHPTEALEAASASALPLASGTLTSFSARSRGQSMVVNTWFTTCH